MVDGFSFYVFISYRNICHIFFRSNLYIKQPCYSNLKPSAFFEHIGMLLRYTDLRYFATYKVVHGCGKTFVSKIEIILCILQSRFLDSIKHSPFYPHCRKSFLVSFWKRFSNWTQSWMWDKKKLLNIKSVLICVKIYTLHISILVEHKQHKIRELKCIHFEGTTRI